MSTSIQSQDGLLIEPEALDSPNADEPQTYGPLIAIFVAIYFLIAASLYFIRGGNVISPDKWLIALFIGAVLLGRGVKFLRDWIPFLLLLFGYAFSWIFALVGLYSTSAESAQQIGFTAIFPLTFISSAFVPIENMPAPLEAFAEVNPFTITVDAMRHLFVGTPAGNSVWGATLWSIGLTIVFAPMAVAKYRRVSSR